MGKSLQVTTNDYPADKHQNEVATPTTIEEKCDDYQRGNFKTIEKEEESPISPAAINHSGSHYHNLQQYNHHQQQHGGLHKKIKNSKIAKHTSEYLQRKLANITIKHVKNSSAVDDLPPIIVHFNQSSMHTRLSRDSDSIMSSSSVATTSTWRATLGPEDNELVSSLSAKQIKYQELLHELIMTEEVYLADLQLVQQIFITDLQSSWHTLPEPIQQTFESLHTIVEFHIAVLRDLRDCQNAQPPLIVGDVVERFRNYAKYFAHFEPANDLIAKSLSNPQTASLKIFGSYVQERCLYPECRSLTLQSFLLKPVQRLMKYPLFLKSQIECFEENDEAIRQHVQCMNEMDAAIRSIEEYKIQTECSSRLLDLSERIRNLQEMGIQLNQPHRRLVHEGPLMLVPTPPPSTQSTSVTKKGPFAPPQRSFSESSKQFFTKQKKKLLYVFLFNDLILFTKIRSKRISQAESELRANSSGGRNLYGPAPDILFKLATVPGQITHLERIVLQRTPVAEPMNYSNSTMTSNRSSSWFGSFCRSGKSKNGGSNGTGSVLSSRSYHQRQPNNTDELYANPFQFICSIASKNIVNMLLEAKTVDEKQVWCDRIESIRDEHCQRGRGGVIGENNKHQQPLATTPSCSSDNSSYGNTELSSPPASFNTSWFSENSLRSLMTGNLEDDDDDDDDDSDELSSIYSSAWDEVVTKSFQTSIFSTEPFNNMNNQN